MSPPRTPQEPRTTDPPEPETREPDPDMTTIFRNPVRPRVDRGAPIELTLVRHTGISHTDATQEWIAFEIWTRHRIYLIGGRMRCIGVVNRLTSQREAENSFLGAVLTGGQRRAADRVEMSQPFPVPGMRAVFRQTEGARGLHRFGETSKVERVVMRLGITHLHLEDVGQAFHDLTARFFMPTRSDD